MTKISLQKILKKEEPQNTLFLVDNSFIWSNKSFMVKDDPNLINYFGEEILRKIIEREKTYYLSIFNKENIKIDRGGSSLKVNFEMIRKSLNEKVIEHTKLELPNERLITNFIGQNTYNLFISGTDLAFFIDKDYFDYIEGIGFNDIYLLKKSYDEQFYIHFTKDKKTIGVVAPFDHTAEIKIKKENIRKLIPFAY